MAAKALPFAQHLLQTLQSKKSPAPSKQPFLKEKKAINQNRRELIVATLANYGIQASLNLKVVQIKNQAKVPLTLRQFSAKIGEQEQDLLKSIFGNSKEAQAKDINCAINNILAKLPEEEALIFRGLFLERPRPGRKKKV